MKGKITLTIDQEILTEIDRRRDMGESERIHQQHSQEKLKQRHKQNESNNK